MTDQSPYINRETLLEQRKWTPNLVQAFFSDEDVAPLEDDVFFNATMVEFPLAQVISAEGTQKFKNLKWKRQKQRLKARIQKKVPWDQRYEDALARKFNRGCDPLDSE